jgi:hypothetical protein
LARCVAVSLSTFLPCTCSAAADEDLLCFVTGRPPAHVADALTAKYVPGMNVGDPSCCAPCEALEIALRWTNASVASVWRVFDDRRSEKNPSAPRMLDAFDEGDLERSSICSMLARYPACVARATAFLGVLGCAPGAVAYAPDLTPELRERLPTSVNATANEDAITITRRVRMCEKGAKDVFDACADVKVLSITTVGAWFGSDPNEFVEIVRRVQRTPRFQRLLASRFN